MAKKGARTYEDILPDPVSAEKAQKAGDQHKMSRQMAQRYLWEPRRVAAMLRWFQKMAFKDNKVLLEYMQYTLPGFKQPEQGAGVTVVIQAPNIDTTPGKYGPDGKLIKDVTPVVTVKPVKPVGPYPPTTTNEPPDTGYTSPENT